MKLFVRWMYFKDLIPHFAKHYEEFEIHALVNTYQCELGMLETLKEYNFNILDVVEHYETVIENFQIIRKHIKRIVKPEEWFVLADPDEFHEFPIPVTKIVNYCDQRKICCHMGTFVDRFAKDGSIPPLKSDVSIFEQFPIKGDIGKILKFKFMKEKVVLVKGKKGLVNPHTHRNSCHQYPIKVHHFKWRKNAIDRLQHRATMYRKHDLSWWEMSQEIVDYLKEHNTLPIKELQNA